MAYFFHHFYFYYVPYSSRSILLLIAIDYMPFHSFVSHDIFFCIIATYNIVYFHAPCELLSSSFSVCPRTDIIPFACALVYAHVIYPSVYNSILIYLRIALRSHHYIPHALENLPSPIHFRSRPSRASFPTPSHIIRLDSHARALSTHALVLFVCSVTHAIVSFYASLRAAFFAAALTRHLRCSSYRASTLLLHYSMLSCCSSCSMQHPAAAPWLRAVVVPLNIYLVAPFLPRPIFFLITTPAYIWYALIPAFFFFH